MTDSLLERFRENRDRPAWVRRHADELEASLRVSEPIPDNLADVADWLRRYTGTVTRQLSPDDPDESPADSPPDGGDDR